MIGKKSGSGWGLTEPLWDCTHVFGDNLTVRGIFFCKCSQRMVAMYDRFPSPRKLVARVSGRAGWLAAVVAIWE